MKKLEELHPGYVLSRNEFKERIVVASPVRDQLCISCRDIIPTRQKCLRYERGNSYQFYEHLKCYEENNGH